MIDSAGTIKNIAQAIEQLAAIRVRQQHLHGETVGLAAEQILDLEAQQVRRQIVSLAETLPIPQEIVEDDAPAYAAA
jgi:hypothetical protein